MNNRQRYANLKKCQSKTQESTKPLEFPKTLTTSIGQRGYSILKSELTETQQDAIKKMLSVKPVMMGNVFCMGGKEPAFPVYRESSKKIYMPRCFGETHFGVAKSLSIKSGVDIDVEFAGSLRDNQVPVVETYMNHIQSRNEGGGLLELPCAYGKCLGKDTPVLMYDGTVKMVQDITTQDVIMGDDSTPRNILSLARGRETMVEICEFGSTEKYLVNKSHILSLIHSRTNKKLDISVQDYLSHPEKECLLGYRVPITFPEKSSIINKTPYNIGYTYNIYSCRPLNQDYVCNSREKQLELLAGIIDMNGQITTANSIEIYLPPNANTVKNSILFLLRSIGFLVKTESIYSFIILSIYDSKYAKTEEIPLQRKIIDFSREHENTDENLNQHILPNLAYEFHLKILEENEYYGFQIDGNRRFVLGDFTVTHNTTISLNIISRLKKKTLVIVHKEFLLNQWVERILQFLPSARVGRIQGQVIDIEDKDIVIGMLQSLSMKEYPETMFESFGLTIIDEVHHISSEVFSRALFKIVTQYMLGLSATMERKDGTTYVFKMFLGDVVYKGSRDEEHDVCVRAIQYVVDDAEFNETEVDFRGNPKFSTMITKLCSYNRRSDFIVRVLKDLLQEQPTKQIMVLSHNRSLLTYIYEAVTHFKIATIGYYVGGMKQTALQDTETKLIVLATYAMAAEALDIKTLSSLVMVTPKTDIVQSVGRILRVKHEKPIVVDIVDSHDIFQNQWAQRRRYYKRCNYRIRHIDSKTYTNMMIDWETDTTWKRVFEPKKNTKTGCSSLQESCESGITEEDDDIDETPRKPVGKCLINIEGMEEL